MKDIKRLFLPPKGSYFLFGPRGTGKSTGIKKHYPHALYIDLLLADVLRTYARHPENLKKIIDAQQDVNTVVIDEIQRAPELLSMVHAIIRLLSKLAKLGLFYLCSILNIWFSLPTLDGYVKENQMFNLKQI